MAGHDAGDGLGRVPWQAPGTKAGELIIGPDGGRMVWVPSGEFMMGSRDDDAHGTPYEKPAHRVRITKGFWVGKCQVTNAQYRTFCQVKARGRGFPKESKNGPNHPVIGVWKIEAKSYCEHYGLVLPTEAQWEYAARGPAGWRYPWGDDWDPKKCCNAVNPGTGLPPTMEVGSLPAGVSWCGASDMAGNVWEWCADWYDYAKRYYAESPLEDPPGPASGPGQVWRGGSWRDGLGLCRSAFRFWCGPHDGYYGVGFRCATTP